MFSLNWRFLYLRGYFLYLICVISFASSMPWSPFLNFSLNLANVSRSKRYCSYSKNALMFLDYYVPAASLSSINSPNLIKLWLMSAFSPGMISLKALAAPSMILSKCFSFFFYLMTSPLTITLPSWTPGSINMSLPDRVMVQCFLCMPNALILISFSSCSDVPTLIYPYFNL